MKIDLLGVEASIEVVFVVVYCQVQNIGLKSKVVIL